VSRIPLETLERLHSAISSHDYLARLVFEIEQLHEAVFHANPSVDWTRNRPAAEQIVIAEIVLRHRGQPDGIYFRLRDAEQAGKSWEAALRDLAAHIHAYYTTPLGLILRRDLFGDRAVFLSPEANELMAQVRGNSPT
jgi:hypothetical protein